MSKIFPADWRTQNRLKRKFYAKYMVWIERLGYVVVLCVLSALVFAFNFQVNDVLKADRVELKPLTVAIDTKETALIIRRLVPDYAEVTAGQPVLEVVIGYDNVAAYRTIRAIEQLKSESMDSLKVAVSTVPRPNSQVITASKSGTFRSSTTDEVAPGGKLGEVLNYNIVEVSSTFEGATVANAMVGDKVTFTNIVFAADSGALLRGDSQQGAVISSQLLDKAVLNTLADRLNQRTISLRNDLQLTVSEVQSLEVDSVMNTRSASDGKASVLLDPANDVAISGLVASGTQQAVVQLADLPADVRAGAEQVIRHQTLGKQVTTSDGRQVRIEDMKDIRLLVKVKVEGVASESGAIAGTALSRSYAAVVRIDNPPAYLIAAMKEADRKGKSVMARAELVTGTRPVAFILLKKS